MTAAEFTKRALAGERLLIVEYRGGAAEQIQWRDNTTGKTLTAIVAKHNVESGPNAVSVSERTGENYKIDDFKPAGKKGQLMVWHVNSLIPNKGSLSGTGTFEPLTQ